MWIYKGENDKNYNGYNYGDRSEKDEWVRNKTKRTEWESGELSGEFIEWNTVARAIETDTYTRTELKKRASSVGLCLRHKLTSDNTILKIIHRAAVYNDTAGSSKNCDTIKRLPPKCLCTGIHVHVISIIQSMRGTRTSDDSQSEQAVNCERGTFLLHAPLHIGSISFSQDGEDHYFLPTL